MIEKNPFLCPNGIFFNSPTFFSEINVGKLTKMPAIQWCGNLNGVMIISKQFFFFLKIKNLKEKKEFFKTLRQCFKIEVIMINLEIASIVISKNYNGISKSKTFFVPIIPISLGKSKIFPEKWERTKE